MKIAIDLLGGDKAPAVVIKGIKIAAAKKIILPDQLVVVGDHAAFALLKAAGLTGIKLIECEPEPLKAIEQGVKAVKEGQAQAFVSAGDTKYMVINGILILGRLAKGLLPAIAVPMPNIQGPCLLIDAGATTTYKATDLFHFAVMGSIYAQRVMRVKDPIVKLLNIGQEEHKGDKVIQETQSLLKTSALNFQGSIEGDGILHDQVNVVVCPGFIGNQLLKFGEGVVGLITKKLGILWPILKYLDHLHRKADHREVGGMPLLGVNGTLIIAHGKSSATEIANAIRAAVNEVNTQVNTEIAKEIRPSGKLWGLWGHLTPASRKKPDDGSAVPKI